MSASDQAGRQHYWLTFSVLDMFGVDGTDLSTQVTSTRYPIIVP